MRSIGVNLAIFMAFRRTVSIDAAPTGLKGLGANTVLHRYRPYGTKEVLKSSGFPRRIRFG